MKMFTLTVEKFHAFIVNALIYTKEALTNNEKSLRDNTFVKFDPAMGNERRFFNNAEKGGRRYFLPPAFWGGQHYRGLGV